ncbi:MAG: GGDEF domain-containing protein [Actinomycetota bacterium]|nr:GGDEF domain-containing protein [Actinomycetota bacterium]
MSPSRITKMLARRVMISWREQPTRFDIEALQANVRRVGLVIRVRWALVGSLAGFSLLGGWAYALEIPLADLWINMRMPALAMVFVLVYNTYYWLTYRHLGNIALLNHAQLMFDAVVVTVLVYFSGGVYSWFWAMYSLFILEAAFILPKRWHTWLIAGFCGGLLGVLLLGEYLQVIPHVTVPFWGSNLQLNRTYVAVRYMWQITVLAGTATVATLMTASIRNREAELAAASILDDKTGLYDRHYFLRALSSELLRAARASRPVHVMLIDIDHFADFNRLVGIERGDAMLRLVADALSESIRVGQDGSPCETNIASRYGGEEFAVVLADSGQGTPGAEDALAFAENVRRAVEGLRVNDAGVTVSIGVASFPGDGSTTQELLDAADGALHSSAAAGGNCSRLAADLD